MLLTRNRRPSISTQPTSILHHIILAIIFLKTYSRKLLILGVELFLGGQGLYGFVDGNDICPLEFLQQHISPKSLILGCTALKAVWDTLSFILASPSITRIMSFHSALLGLKQSLDETVTTYP